MREFELFSEVMKKHANGCSISIGNRIKLQDFWSKAEKVETMSRHIYFTKPSSFSAIQKPHKKKKTATGITATFTRENRSSPITSTPITSFGYNKINFPGRDIKKRTTRIDSVTKRNSIYWVFKVDFCIVCITCKVNKTQRESILSVYILL